MLLLLFQCKQNTSTPPISYSTVFCSSLYTHPSFTATGLKLELINRFFSVIHCGICLSKSHSSEVVYRPLLIPWDHYQTAFFWQDFFLLELCVLYLANPFFYCNEVNKLWCIDLLMVWSLLVCLIVFQIKLSFYKACTAFLETFNLAVFWPREKTLFSALTIWL